jgi:phenylacetate-coenzyme A ligase PaaK-like adenylate-forming protein
MDDQTVLTKKPHITMTPSRFLSKVKELPETLEPAHIGSNILAPLFSYLIIEPVKYHEGYKLLQNKLLDMTIRMAKVNAPYYKEIIPNHNHWLISKLDQLPTLSKNELYQNRLKILSEITTFGFVTFTTGTTNQPPLLIERSQEEQLYLQNFFSILQSGMLYSKKRKPLGIVEGSMNHGSVLRLPGIGYNFMIELTKDYGVIRTAWLLQNKFNFNGIEHKVSQLNTTVMGLSYLYQYLTEHNIEIPKDQLNSITIFGWPVPKSRRKKFEDFFNVKISDNYSMSEMFGGAKYCQECDGYHFDPFVIPEIVDLETGKQLETGTGELVLTPLFPFTQRFVLIRYRTGDLVDVTKANCDKGTLVYKFRGRLNRCVKMNSNLYFGEAEIAKAIDEIEELNRAPTGFNIFKDNDINNWPLFKMVKNEEQFEILIELKFNPKEDSDVTQKINNRIYDKILLELPKSVTNWIKQNPDNFKITLKSPCSFEKRDYWNL